ncbi:hypothetical protein Micbo1qcDRAFT_27425 [Microdochium bolleyi]|uniref:JmjC domain-containing protein n=1 Tax=Microdochium bolleyi TaxID=196109 RepID=A0A136JEJ0_9PEZI|nr:hypothetical protein Micbo1qcDRAFT_27425 [Microdochium bolleyi]
MLLAQGLDNGGAGRTTIVDSIQQEITFDDQDLELDADAIPTHPLGIKPLGNQYLATGPSARQSLGAFGILPDELILHLVDYFDADSLRSVASTCRFLFGFGQLDDLWKTLYLEANENSSSQPTWRGSWRSTLLRLDPSHLAQVNCGNVFSDVLHRPFACSHINLGKHIRDIPPENRITRLDDLDCDEFSSSWSNKPFVLTKSIRSWPVLEAWSIVELRRKYSGTSFRAEAVDWPMSVYADYMTDSKDESPLYLFDKTFAEKMQVQVGKGPEGLYWAPDCFGYDFFALLGQERPAHRWLIVGPERSGSTFHKDPNATSAWNAVVEGSKYWIMFPPSAQVPGVFVSEDSSEVTSPLSIAEWLLEFHAEAREQPGCVEGICGQGEILHVPSGWWHLVVNLEPGIALTQNFVPRSHLADVLSFLRDKPDQVSGFKKEIDDPYELFVGRLRENYPDLLEDAMKELERRSHNKKRKWEEATKPADDGAGASGGFSFGFGGDSDAEIP